MCILLRAEHRRDKGPAKRDDAEEVLVPAVAAIEVEEEGLLVTVHDIAKAVR